MIKAVIDRYDSAAFPFQARWKIGSVSYSDVFETPDQAESYLVGRFKDVKIIDKTRKT